MQADQNLSTLAGLADHAFELREPPRGFTLKDGYKLVVDAKGEGKSDNSIAPPPPQAKHDWRTRLLR